MNPAGHCYTRLAADGELHIELGYSFLYTYAVTAGEAEEGDWCGSLCV